MALRGRLIRTARPAAAVASSGVWPRSGPVLSRSAPPDSNRFIGICTTRKWWSAPPASSAALSNQETDVASGSSGAATTVFEDTP